MVIQACSVGYVKLWLMQVTCLLLDLLNTLQVFVQGEL